MMSNHSFADCLKNESRRNAAAYSFMALIFFFQTLISYIIQVSGMKGTAGWRGTVRPGPAVTLLGITESALGRGAGSAVMIFAAAGLAALEFGYLHRKPEADFYHGLPETRREIFAYKFLTGILTVMLPYLLIMAIASAYGIASGVPAGKMAAIVLPTVALNFLYFMLQYALFVLAMILTGKMFVGFLGMAVLDAFFPLALAAAEAYCAALRNQHVWEKVSAVLLRLSPTAAFLEAVPRTNGGCDGPACAARFLPLLMAVVMLVLYLCLSVKLYERRPLEAAGNAMAFERSKAFIRIPVVILTGLLFGLMFGSGMGTGMGWTLFGITAGTVISHCIMEIIYHFDFRALFSHRRQLFFCLAIGWIVAFVSGGV